MNPDFSVEKRILQLNETVAICEKVKAVTESAGWVEIIEPLIDKSITDITGRKMPNGRWHGGLLDRAKKDEQREFHIGYKQALIDLHGRIYAYPDSIKRCEQEKDEIIKNKSKGFTTPLVDDTAYGNKRAPSINRGEYV